MGTEDDRRTITVRKLSNDLHTWYRQRALQMSALTGIDTSQNDIYLIALRQYKRLTEEKEGDA